MARTPINLGREPYRYTCPRGHVAVTSRKSGWAKTPYYCDSCSHAGKDAHYTAEDLIDGKRVNDEDDGGWCGP